MSQKPKTTKKKPTLSGKLSKVVVFQGRAELNHSATAQLEPGVHHLAFQNVSPLIIPESVRLHGKSKGKAKGRVISSETKTRFEAKVPSAEIKLLEQKLKALEIKKRDFEFDKNHLTTRITNLSSIWAKFIASDSLPKRFSMGQLKIKSVQDAEEYFQSKIAELQKTLYEIDKKLEDFNIEYEAIRRQYHHLTQGGDVIRHQDILITVDVQIGGTFAFDIKYQCNNANWTPQYDVEITENNANFTLLAMISNRTQLDWNNVHVTVSTASTRTASANEPSPFYLDLFRPRPAPTRGVPAPMAMKASLARDMRKKEKVDDFDVGEEAIPMEEMEVLEAETSKIGEVVMYTLRDNLSIPSDNEEHSFVITSFDLKTQRDYWWDSSSTEEVVERIRVTNTETVLLPGKTKTTADGEYIGESSISLIAPKEEFSLVTRTAHALKAKKKLVDRKADEGLIRKDKAIREYSYDLLLENHRNELSPYTIFAVIPHSVHQKIEITLETAEPKPHSNQLGVLKWEGKIPPTGKTNIQYAFKVTYPTGERVSPSLP
ncbi:MAG: DUF4139 domain-containing protein [Candidatus Ranarchaeia archaeon]|jgi:uncharacterized protein (TIGR02231 family)